VHVIGRIVLLFVTALLLSACGGSGSVSVQTVEGSSGAPRPEHEAAPVADPAARARAGGWSAASLEPPPHYCNDEGGTEWCEGERDDDCDGVVDEGCADCVNQTCVRYAISEEELQRGTGRSGTAECIGPVYCGRIDGTATTEPPGGCGTFHCGTLVYDDGTAQPYHCTIYGRCVDDEFVAKGFSW